jgi:hypothetical protein
MGEAEVTGHGETIWLAITAIVVLHVAALGYWIFM